MYQFRKKQTRGVITLPASTGVPGMDEIAYLYNRGQENKERFVELPWKSGEPQQSFSLTVKCAPPADAAWTLYRGEGKQSTVAWSYTSGDIGLVLNMVLMELDREVEVKEDTRPQDIYKTTLGSIDQELQNLVRRTQLGLGPEESVPAEFTQEKLDREESQAASKPSTGEVRPAAFEAVAEDEGGVRETSRPGIEEPQFHLEGNLKNISVSSILTYVSMGKLTGRLSMEAEAGAGEIYFEFGFPRHASTLETRGEQAFYELFGWVEGEYNFYQGEKANQRTIEKTFEELMEVSESLLQMAEYLKAIGLTQDAYLACAESRVSDEEFQARLPELEGWQLVLYRQTFGAIDGKKTLFDLLRLRPMVRSEWLPLIYNLVQSKLVTHTKEPRVMYDALKLKPVALDFEEIELSMQVLCRRDTGIMQPGAFLHFVSQEFHRYERTGSCFSLIAFEVGIRQTGAANESDLESLSSAVLQAVGQVVNKTKRKIDQLGHFDQFKLQDYLLLLPGTDSYGAAVFANRVQDNLHDLRREQKKEGRILVTHFGVASVPDDCREMGILIAAALEAKKSARLNSESNVVLFSELFI